MVQELGASDFDAYLKENPRVLVDFWAPWCGPCRMVAPVLERLHADAAGKVKVAKVNIDDNDALAERFGVNLIPTLIYFEDGAEKQRELGVQPIEKLRKLVRLD